MAFWLAELSRAPARTATRGLYVSPASVTGRRLSVSADETATVLELGSCTVVFDGELHDGTRKIVGSAAAERVLRAYLDADAVFPERLRGVFALMVWDRARDVAVCARDPLGVQPLFYAEESGTLYVSPSPDRLVAGTPVSRSVNRHAVGEWVVRGNLDPDETFYEAVKRLPSGHLLEEADGQTRAARFWLPELDHRRVGWTDPAEAVDAFETILRQAVERSLGAGRPAVQVSGGVDSATVAAAAARVSRERSLPAPLALSLEYPISAADEGLAQRAVATALGLEHVIVPLSEACGPSVVLAGLRKSAESWLPCLNPWGSAWDFLLGRAKELGCDAVLGGEGGNDWLEVGWPWAADLLLTFDIMALHGLLKSERAFYGRAMAAELLWRQGLRLLARAAVEPTLRRAAPGLIEALFARRRSRGLPNWALPDPELRRELIERRAAKPGLDRVAGSFARGERKRLLEGPHFSLFLESQTQEAVEAGVRARHPLHDADLVEFLSSVEPEVLNLGGEVKGLARAVLRRRLGSQAARSLSSAYTDPVVSDALRRDGRRALDALGGTPLLRELGIVDGSAFRAALDALVNGTGSSYALWDTLACEGWLQARTSTTTGEIGEQWRLRQRRSIGSPGLGHGSR